MTESPVRRWVCAVVAVALAFVMLTGSANVGGVTKNENAVMAGKTPCPTVPVPPPITRGSNLPIVMNPCPGYEWAKSFGIAGAYDAAASLDTTSDGGVVVLVFTHLAGATVVKLDGEGTVQWQKKYGVGNTGPGDITETSDGGFAMAISGDSGLLGYNVYKLNANGDILWRISFDSPGTDWANSIAETPDGGFIVGGETDGPNVGDQYLWVLRLDPMGGLVWQRTYGGLVDLYARSGVLPTSDGGFVAAGWGATFGFGFWVIKMDSSGNVIWQKKYRPASGGVNQFGAIATTSDGGYVMSGAINDKWTVVKLTATGSIQWQKTYGDNRGGFGSLIQTSDGGYIISAAVVSNSSMGIDLGLLRIDSAGKRLWQRTYGGTSTDSPCSPHCLREASDGNFVVAGRTSSFGTQGGSSSWYNTDAWVLRVFSDGSISSTCAPGFGTAFDSPTVSGSKLKTEALTFTSPSTAVEGTNPGATTSPGTLVTMTQCAA